MRVWGLIHAMKKVFFTSSLTEQPQACLDRVTEALLKEATFELRHQ